MSLSPPRVQANAIIDGNREGRDGGGAIESEGGKHDGVSHCRRWRVSAQVIVDELPGERFVLVSLPWAL